MATSFGNLVGKVAKVVEGGQSRGLARVGVQHVIYYGVDQMIFPVFFLGLVGF